MKKRLVLLNPNAEETIRNTFRRLDIQPVEIPRSANVHPALSGHADIQFFLSGNMLFTHPGLPASFIRSIDDKIDIRVCNTPLGAKYPEDCRYNIAATGKYAFHKLRYTETAISDHLHETGVRMIDVRQGYSRCSTLVVDENSIVTADVSIHSEALKAGLNALLIRPGHVGLKGFKYGFIGGASGHDAESVYLSGRLEQHPDGNAIHDFIAARGKRVINLSDGHINDLGSFLIFESAR